MRNIYLIIIALSTLTLGSCSRYYYKPNGANVPLFTDGGQAHFNVAGSVNSDGTGTNNNGNSTGSVSVFDFQGAVSPVNHLGLIANYSTYNYTTTTLNPPPGDVNARAYLAELGVGGYYALGGRKVKMVVDLYAGGGIGAIRSDIDADVNRIFIQPGIGMRSPWFDVAFSPRIVNIGYNNFSDNGRGDAYLRSQGLLDGAGRIDQRRYTFFEPCITMRAGYKFAKVQFQYVIAAPMTSISWNTSPGRFSFGFYFTLEDLISTIKEGPKP